MESPTTYCTPAKNFAWQEAPLSNTHFIYFGPFIKKNRRDGHRKFSFNKSRLLGRIVDLFKSPLTDLPSISNLSANAIFLWL